VTDLDLRPGDTVPHADRVSELFEAESGALLRYFLRRVEVREDAADLVAETALVLWRRAADLPGDAERDRMWMYGIARRTLSGYRRSGIRRRALADRLRDELATTGDEAPAGPQLDEVRSAVRALPQREQDVVALVHWEGFTVTAAAAVLGIRPGTAQMRYSRARARLRQMLA